MCDQAPSKCKMSIKVIFLDNPEQKDEEEWYGYQYYHWSGFIMLPILYGETNKRMSNQECPVCRNTLLEKRAGFYCYNYKCPAYGQKAITCCEGELC